METRKKKTTFWLQNGDLLQNGCLKKKTSPQIHRTKIQAS